MDNLLQLLIKLKEGVEQLELAPRDRQDIEAEISTFESQMKSSRPRISTLRDSTQGIKTILQGASGNALGTLLIRIADQIWDALPTINL